MVGVLLLSMESLIAFSILSELAESGGIFSSCLRVTLKSKSGKVMNVEYPAKQDAPAPRNTTTLACGPLLLILPLPFTIGTDAIREQGQESSEGSSLQYSHPFGAFRMAHS